MFREHKTNVPITPEGTINRQSPAIRSCGKTEAVEFEVDDATKHCGVPLKEMRLKKNVLMAAITHGTKTEIPAGDSFFQKGDTVVVVTSGCGVLRNINDIFA